MPPMTDRSPVAATSRSTWARPAPMASRSPSSRSVDIAKDAEKYFRDSEIPFFLWLRLMTGRRLMNTHRMHLDAQIRDVGREISIHQQGVPGATSVSLADCFAGNLTSASRAAVRAEAKSRLEQGLNEMEPLDREILVLRHLEEMSNQEVAECLGLSKSAASNRYVRALKRLNAILSELRDWTIE